jgi:hypothetical protein
LALLIELEHFVEDSLTATAMVVIVVSSVHLQLVEENEIVGDSMATLMAVIQVHLLQLEE